MHFQQLLTSTVLIGIAAAGPLAPRAVVTSTSTSCSFTSVLPSPTPLICGQEGVINNPRTIMSWDASTNANVCLDYCKKTAACISYAYVSDLEVCQYYNASIKSSDFDVGPSGIFYWNKRCFEKSCEYATFTSTVKPATTSKVSTIKSATTVKPTTTLKSTTTVKPATTTKPATTVKPTTTSTVKSSSAKSSSINSVKTTTVRTTSVRTTTVGTTSVKTTTVTASSSTRVTPIVNKPTTSSKTTTTTAPAAPTCTAPSSDVTKCQSISVPVIGSLLTTLNYNLYFDGTGVTENPENPGNSGLILLAPSTISLSGSLSLCDAATQCATRGGLLGLLKLYQSFDLHFVKSECEWECVLYAKANTAGSYFNVVNSTIGAVAGFSGTVAKVGIL